MDDPISRYFELVNSDRFDELRGLFSADIVMEMAGASRREGPDAAIGFYARALAPLPVHLDDPVSVVRSADGRRVAVEIAFTGATVTGTAVQFTAVDLFDLDANDQICRLRSFYDTAAVAAMLTGATLTSDGDG